MLDDLVSCIELLKERMQSHRAALKENETRTRVALIDPLLRALGWDVADPAVVIPEYKVGNRSADYALLRSDGRVGRLGSQAARRVVGLAPGANAHLRQHGRHRVRRAY